MFSMDATKSELSRTIIKKQMNLNYNNSERQRLRNHNDIFTDKTVSRIRNTSDPKEHFGKDLAHIQKEQIELKRIDAANDLIRSRIQDEENLITGHERFPFGKENVEVSEDVLERYKGNYYEQSRMLEKFKLEAELIKKTAKYGLRAKPFVQWDLQRSPPKAKNDNELEKMRETLQRRLEEGDNLREIERNNLRNIVNSLSGLSIQLHNNSFTLEKGIRDLQNKFKRTERNRTEIQMPHKAYRDILDLEAGSNKIPIIVQENQEHHDRLYFSDIFRSAPKISKNSHTDLDRGEYKNVMTILHENNRRLAYLDKLSNLQRE